MGAPLGNQFWKRRAKHGRDKLFATPELLWQAACEYFQYQDDNPYEKNEMIKSGDFAKDIVGVPTIRPYTLQGLCLYLDCNTKYFNEFEVRLNEKKEHGKEQQIDKDFADIITRIKETIYIQKFEGAMVGAFNPVIVARDLGLTDKINVEQTGAKETINLTINGSSVDLSK